MIALLLAGCTYTRDVPVELTNIARLTEDAYDHALAERWTDVADDAKDVETAWKSFRSRAVGDGVPFAVADTMDDAVEDLVAESERPTSAIDAARAANAVTSVFDDLFGSYDLAQPPDLLDLRGR